MSEKIQKVLAREGLASRREIERWIQAGRIKVNGKEASLGDRISMKDKVKVDDKLVQIKPLNQTRVILYNKPEGEVVTRDESETRPLVFDALPDLQQGRWVSIGRLDINTSGLLLLTNDGQLAHQLMHPSFHVEREYAVRVFGQVDADTVKRLVTGVRLEDGMARFEDVVGSDSRGANRWFHVVIAQGRNRIVRRLWESQDCQVSRLMRVRFGPVVLPDNLPSGKWRELNDSMIKKLSDLSSE